ncbi:MAG TPA: DUF1295 domain-containing protein [Spirochaetia bacterium]|nr:DUF1295 domain-containing protein [Spirochaetia bacterium]
MPLPAPRSQLGRSESLLLCLTAYLISAMAAVAAGWAVGRFLGWHSAVWMAAAGDLAATVVVFAFSAALDNSSVYDPYWSVAPVFIAGFWLASYGPARPRALLALACVALWALRLTANWLRRWRGLSDEDWRYADYRRLGAGYWPVSFLGFHLFPTIIVFLGCLPLTAALAWNARPVGALDAVAVAVTLAAILIESTADRQLRAFLDSPREPGSTLETGLWALTRHPNYFGEVLFWWGLYLFGLAADPSRWWTIVGPLGITALFLGVSVPMMDRRMTAGHPGYAEQMRLRSAFLPLPPRREG